MAGMAVSWNFCGRGWADVVVSDWRAEVRVAASYVSAAPEELLTAVARLVLGEEEVRAQFEAEPTVFRWVFRRDGGGVEIRLLELPDGRGHDDAGTEIWSKRSRRLG